MSELVAELNRLAGVRGRGAAWCANEIAGTSGLEVVGALNAKAGTRGLELNGVCRELASQFGGDSTLDAVGALRSIGSIGLGTFDLLAESGDRVLTEDGFSLLLEEAT